jgi:hypothetical protein
MIKEYNKNKPIVDAYLQGKSIENYSMSGDGMNGTDKTILGLSIGVFTVIFIINLLIFIGAIVLLVNHWNDPLPDWAKVCAIVFLVMGLPLVSLIILLITKK